MIEITNLISSTGFLRILVETLSIEDFASFSFIRGEFLADGTYFILYKSQSKAILLEIQSTVTKLSFKRSIEKCLEVSDQYDIEPTFVVLADETFPSVTEMLSLHSEKSGWKTLNSTVWAKECVVFSKDAINFSENEAGKYDPLIAFTFYFFGGVAERQTLRPLGNPMITLTDEIYS
ncbi:unnamed protein product [Mucor hiemalis]